MTETTGKEHRETKDQSPKTGPSIPAASSFHFSSLAPQLAAGEEQYIEHRRGVLETVTKARSGKETEPLYLLRDAVADFPFLGEVQALSALLVQGWEGGWRGQVFFSSYAAETCYLQ